MNRPISELKKHKVCKKCNRIRNKREFYENKRNKDGLYSKCISCHNEVRGIRMNSDS